MLIGGKQTAVLAFTDLQRQDLRGKMPLFDGCQGFLLTAPGKLVHCLTADVKTFRDELGGHTVVIRAFWPG
ncbi:hypothetical protein D3C75_1222210 [compost metagenome]